MRSINTLTMAVAWAVYLSPDGRTLKLRAVRPRDGKVWFQRVIDIPDAFSTSSESRQVRVDDEQGVDADHHLFTNSGDLVHELAFGDVGLVLRLELLADGRAFLTSRERAPGQLAQAHTFRLPRDVAEQLRDFLDSLPERRAAARCLA